VKSIEEVLAANVRNRRKALKMSQTDLAKKAKLSLHTIFRIEKAEQAPRRANIDSIAKALHCTREELYSGSIFTTFESGTPTTKSLLRALGTMQEEVDKIKSNPLVSYALSLTELDQWTVLGLAKGFLALEDDPQTQHEILAMLGDDPSKPLVPADVDELDPKAKPPRPRKA
jgi:transcriptional regulator with XRE-family HTH domain